MTFMRIAQIGVAVLAAALAPAAVFAAVGGSLSLLTISFGIALAHAVLLGLPTFLVLRTKNWVNGISTPVAGFIIGAIPVGVLSWPMRYSDLKSNAWTGPERVQTMLDGVPTLAGWLQYLQGLLFFGAFGALGGIAFWATLRVAGQLPFRRADAEDISPHSHRPSVLPWRAFLLGAVPLLAIAVLAVPAITKDRSCHNMFRDGRTSIAPVVRIDLQIVDEDWPILVERLRTFAEKYEFSLRDDSKVTPDVMRALYLSVCNEQGVNINIAEQRWAHNKYENALKERGVSINIYVQKDETNWRPVARFVADNLETRWPGKLQFRDERGQVAPKPQSLSSPAQ